MSDLTTPRYPDAVETAGFPDMSDGSDIEQVRLHTLSRWMDAERESWAARCLSAIASGVTTLALIEAEMRVHDEPTAPPRRTRDADLPAVGTFG